MRTLICRKYLDRSEVLAPASCSVSFRSKVRNCLEPSAPTVYTLLCDTVGPVVAFQAISSAVTFTARPQQMSDAIAARSLGKSPRSHKYTYAEETHSHTCVQI